MNVRILVRILIAGGFAAFLACRTLVLAGTPGGKGAAAAISSSAQVAFVDPRALRLLNSATSASDASPAIQLANISTRLAVGSGDNVLIAGFIITGSQPKKVVLRGLGPLLPVNENLSDPTLELHRGADTLASNDNWRDSQEDAVKATTIPPI